MKKLITIILCAASLSAYAYWTDSWSNPYAEKYGFEQYNYYKTKFADKTFDSPMDYQYQYFNPNLDKYGYQPKEYEPHESEYNTSATPSSSYYKKTADDLNRTIGPVYQR
ncbi:MAG: hypothetical protein ACOYT8_05715 [Candidatus Dependentiae bacterium]